MSDKTVSVGLKIEGDASGAQAAVEATEKSLNKLPETTGKASRAANQLDAAFDKIGIRSAAKIEADILEINQALIKLAQRSNVTGDEFDRAFAAGKQRIAALRAELRSVPDEMGRVGQKADNMLGLFGKLGLAFTGVELARQFVMVNAELENVERSFVAVTGSTAQASAEMEYARGVANRLGLEQISTAKAYASLMASTKGSAVEGEVSRQVFESVARSMSLAGKSAADTEGALLALQQMASKGVVSMEELRGQLGERLPGALNAAAEGLGITTAQLIKLTESGQLTAEELFPALAAGLDKLYANGGAETLTQEWNHFTTALQDAAVTIEEAGAVSDLFKKTLEALSAYISIVAVGFVALGEKIGVFLGALANGEIGINGFSDTAKEAFAEIEKSAQDKLLKSAGHNEVLAAMMGDAGKAAQASAHQQSTAAGEAASGWTRLNVAFGTVKEAGAAATKQAEKTAEATKAEGDAAMHLAQALGGETDKQKARANAARQTATAMAAVAERRREELAMVTEHIAALEREAAAGGGATEQQQKVIDGLKLTAEARQADADKATAQAAQSQAVAVQTQVEAASYEQAHGALSAFSITKQAQLSVDQAGIRLAIEKQRTILAVARANGDEYAAASALVEIKRLEIRMAELTAEAKRAEAKAAMAAAQAQREYLQASGLLTPAKEAELKALEAGAKVKEIEGQIASETAKRLRELADASRESGGAADGSAGGYNSMAGAMHNAADAAERLRRAQRGGGGRSDEALRDKDGNLVTSSTSILDMGGSPSQKVDIASILYKNGASVEEAKLAEKYYGELYQREAATRLTGNLGNEDNAARQTNLAAKYAAEEAIRLARQEKSTGQAVDLGMSVEDIQKRNLATTNWSSMLTSARGENALMDAIKSAGLEAKAQPVKIMIGQRQATVNTSSAADAQRLTSILKLLETDAGRTYR